MDNEQEQPPVDPASETVLERVEQAVEAAVERVEEAVVAAVHTIEHRTFGRASADEPMPVTTVTGN